MPPNLFDPKKQLTKADFQLYYWGTLITIRWSKTIQFHKQIVEIPLPRIPHFQLCPTAAIVNAFRLNSLVSMQAFAWVDDRQASHVFTYGLFVSALRRHLAAMGVDSKLYAGHSFHRGCILCVPIGRPIELIKALGDWRFDTIVIYLTMPLTVQLHSANMLCKAILLHTPPQDTNDNSSH